MKTDDYSANRSLFSEGLAIAEEMGDRRQVGISLINLGELARLHGRDAESITLYRQSIPIWEESGQRSMLGWCYHNLGYSLLHEKQYSEANKNFVKGMSLFRELKEDSGVAACLAGLGGVALAEGSSERAARLLGATAAIFERTGTRLDPVDTVEYEKILSSTKLKLTAERFTAERDIGRTWTLDQAIAEGLER
jgi:hypothetical protein